MLKEHILGFISAIFLVIIFYLLALILHGIVSIDRRLSDIEFELKQTSSVLVQCPEGEYVAADVGSLTIIHTSR